MPNFFQRSQKPPSSSSTTLTHSKSDEAFLYMEIELLLTSSTAQHDLNTPSFLHPSSLHLRILLLFFFAFRVSLFGSFCSLLRIVVRPLLSTPTGLLHTTVCPSTLKPLALADIQRASKALLNRYIISCLHLYQTATKR
eukprot:gene13231-9077_t